MLNQFKKIYGTSWLQGRRLLPMIINHSASETGVVLDVGCGTSPFRPYFNRASSYIRVDCYPIDSEVLVVDDILNLPVATGSVSIVIASRMLSDIPNTESFLRELHRVLVPGGKILVYEQIVYPQHDLPHDYWRILPQGLKWLAAKTGFDVVEVEPLGGYFVQVALHWNQFFIAPLNRFAITRPLMLLLRAAGNLACAGLDAIAPRPVLAADYFACLVKPLDDSARAQ